MARPKKNPEHIVKICEGCNKEFTVLYRKKHQRFCNKSCAQNSPNVKSKMKISQRETFDKKYGGHPMKTQQTIFNFKKTMLNKYGVEHALQNNDLAEKSKKTKLERYRNDKYNNREQAKMTNLERYGVENFTKTDIYKKMLKESCLIKYGTEFPSQSESYREKFKKTIYNRFSLQKRFDNFVPLFDINSFNGVSDDIKYKFKCNRCENISLYKLSDGRKPLCINCDKLNSSKEQKEIYDFLKENLSNDVIVISNEKTILYPKEIDLYIPSLNLCIEYNSLYWHSEVSGFKNKVYHLNKTKNCISKGLRLIHIFETEWLNKKEIVKSILRNILNKNTEKFYARECEVKMIDKNNADIFLFKNHIQGFDNSSIRLGLYNNNELISVMTFGKSRYDKNCEYEMYRFCNLINTTVVGGASKLFSHFIKMYKPKSVVSYSDRKYFNGDLYITLKFNFVKNTSPNYYYIIDDYKNIKSRIAFQKHKLPKILETFDPKLTEWENMKLNGYDRIWDCGNGKWIYKN